jgi:DNA-binding NtrC family response regulator
MDSATVAPGAESPFRRARAAQADKRWPRLIGEAEATRQLESAIQRVASFDCPVLITGETGCGKEEVARAIHAAGPRHDKPFLAINCGGLVASLAESQLFGHEKGAFTGAAGASRGAFRAADGGVVFLDEIGELPLELQPKLLRVLQRWEVTPVGSTETHTVNVQVLAATNRDLEAEVDQATFREDLLYRLNTIHLSIPPLRARPDDIPRFLDHFSAHFAREYGRPQWRPDAGALARLQAYGWPGNVRQLAQLVQRLYVFEDRIEDVLADLFRSTNEVTTARQPRAELPEAAGAAPSSLNPPRAVASATNLAAAPAAEPLVPVFNLDELRRLAVRQALAAVNGHRGQAAALLGVSLNTMTRLVAEVDPEATATTGRKRRAAASKPR